MREAVVLKVAGITFDAAVAELSFCIVTMRYY